VDENMKKCLSKLMASVVVGSLIVIPVQAAPDTDSIQNQLDAAQSQVNDLQTQLRTVLNRIYALEEDMITKGEEIIQAEEDLEIAQVLEQQQYEDMKLRIKYMYEEGNNTAFEKILTSGSISEMLNQAEYVQNIHGYDREMLNEYVKTKDKVTELKSTLEIEMSELQSMQVDFSDQQASLNSMIVNKQSEITNLDDQLQEAVQAAAVEAQARAEAQQAEENQVASAAESNIDSNTNTSNNTSSNTSTNNNNGSNNTNNSNSSSTNTGNSNNTNNSSNNSNSSSNSSTDSTSSGNTATAQKIVNAAYSQLGVDYVWGGTAPGVGLDCSGLTQYAHKQAGISIGRTSGVQGAGGKAVSTPQAGDLVCYAGHVGIYIGGGQMIHAPQTGAVVRVQSVYGSPWYRRYW